jgi:hypothetical protein
MTVTTSTEMLLRSEKIILQRRVAALEEDLAALRKQHTAFVTHVRVACTCLSAPLFLDQEGKSDVHDAARAALKYLREAIDRDS